MSINAACRRPVDGQQSGGTSRCVMSSEALVAGGEAKRSFSVHSPILQRLKRGNAPAAAGAASILDGANVCFCTQNVHSTHLLAIRPSINCLLTTRLPVYLSACLPAYLTTGPLVSRRTASVHPPCWCQCRVRALQAAHHSLLPPPLLPQPLLLLPPSAATVSPSRVAVTAASPAHSALLRLLCHSNCRQACACCCA